MSKVSIVITVFAALFGAVYFDLYSFAYDTIYGPPLVTEGFYEKLFVVNKNKEFVEQEELNGGAMNSFDISRKDGNLVDLSFVDIKSSKE